MTLQVMAAMTAAPYAHAMNPAQTVSTTSRSRASHAGQLLREWRSVRRLSQLDLALQAGVSSRHLSCVETGKAQPSRDMLGRLAEALDMPLREHNALLVAAGFAPMYPESDFQAPALAQVRGAIEAMLRQQEPYPAFLMNRHWDILMANDAARRISDFVMRGKPSAHDNMLRQFFDPADFRQAVANWEEVAGQLVRHLHSEIAASPSDARARALLDEVLAYPNVPAHWRQRDPGTAPSPLLTTVLRRDADELRFFSAITMFGTPRDVTLDDIHVECCFPVDDATAALCRRLAEDAVV